MFKKLNSQKNSRITFTFNGETINADVGETVATALLAAGIIQFRTTEKQGEPRGPHCMMGSCFECIVEIDGGTRRQACLEPVVEGLRVTSIEGTKDE